MVGGLAGVALCHENWTADQTNTVYAEHAASFVPWPPRNLCAPKVGGEPWPLKRFFPIGNKPIELPKRHNEHCLRQSEMASSRMQSRLRRSFASPGLREICLARWFPI